MDLAPEVTDVPQDHPSLPDCLREIADDLAAPSDHRRLAGFLVADIDARGKEHARRLDRVAAALRMLGIDE